MDEHLEKQIQARFDELPEDIQKAIQSADTDKKIQEISAKYKLHIDQVDVLNNEVYLVMLGFADPGELSTQLAAQLRLSNEQANALAQDISTQLFVPIRKSMQEYTDERVLQDQLANMPKDQKPAAVASVPIPPPALAPKPIMPPTPPVPPTPITPAAAPMPTPKPVISPVSAPAAPAIPKIDTMLSRSTIQTAPTPSTPSVAPAPMTPSSTPPPKPADAPKPAVPPPPANYKLDPYREPID